MTRAANVFSILALCISLAASALAQESREVHKSGAFGQNGRISVDTYKGSIEIVSWDKSEIDVRAVIEADGTDWHSRQQVEDTDVRIDLSTHSARIKTDYDRVKHRHYGFFGLFSGEWTNLPFVHYTIKVPRTTNVVIKDYKSRTTVDDLQSDVEIDTYKGIVEIDRLVGSTDLKTYKGRARLDFADLARQSRIETYKGNVEVTLPRGKGFDLDTDLGRHARLRSDFERIRNRENDRHRRLEMRTSVNGGGPLLRVKSDHGSIQLSER